MIPSRTLEKEVVHDMFPAQRRRLIAKQINENGYVSIPSLCDYFQVSEMTIHRDLYALEAIGQIKKTRGGAVVKEDLLVPVNYRVRAGIHEAEKERIGKKAVEIIGEGETIFLDASTTSMYIAKNLNNFEKLTVYTHSHMMISTLMEKPGIEVHSVGGLVSKETMALVGSEAEAAMTLLRPDRCFVGAAGISIEEGVYDPSLPEASMKRAIVKASREVYLVATSEKFNQIAPYISVPLEMIDMIITDSGIHEKFIKGLNEKGIRCLLA